MKKLINIFILLVICFMPFVVDAKANIDFDWDLINHTFLYEEDDKYYFIDHPYQILDNSKLITYDDTGELVSEELFYDPSKMTEEEFYNSKRYLSAYYTFHDYEIDNTVYDKENGINYVVDYIDEEFFYYDEDTNNWKSIPFDNDLNYTRKLLGERYDIFLELKSKNIPVSTIKIDNDIVIVKYEDYDNYENYYFYVFDSNLNKIFEKKHEGYGHEPTCCVHDGLVYILFENILEIYKLDGTLYDSFTIDEDYKFITKDDDYFCGSLFGKKIEVKDNKLLLYFIEYECNGRIIMNDENDLVRSDIEEDDWIDANQLFLKYSLDFDVNKVSSEDGDFTFKRKFNSNGEYVELEIVPKKGYYVKDIIVTDIYGKRIEVKDNKFLMPMNDVTIEIKYDDGEYLPIPDTAMSKSISLLIIGFVLMGLGVYTINYVKE